MSGVVLNEYIFTWRIKNYSSFYQVKGEYIASPSFSIENIPDSQWSLCIYPKGSSELENNENFVSCSLRWKPLNETNKSDSISFSIEIVDEKGSVLECMESKDTKFSKESAILGWPQFFAIDELEKEMNSWTDDVLTLRFRTRTDSQRKNKLSESIACTTIKADRYSVGWFIEMPSRFGYSEYLAFPISNLYDFEITLTFMEESLRILIHFKDDQCETSHQLTFTFSFFDKIGCKLGSKRARYFCEKSETWSFPDFITKELLSCCKVNSFLYEFTLKCEVCISKKNISSLIERSEIMFFPCSSKSIPKQIPTSTMQNDFRNILMNKTYSDITIHSKSDDFPAHKFVLKVRSPVFAAMFNQDMLENKTGVMVMADIDGKTLKAFLEYLYTETVDGMDYDIAKNLIVTADKYEVPSLVDECASFLKPILSTENVCEIIAIADMIGCENLKSYALNFIMVNVAEILPTAAWTEWIEGNIKLATYILSKVSVVIGSNYKLV